MFKKAVKDNCYLRLALVGISGSGKTFSSLQIATHMGGPIALIDTERGSASKYAELFDFDVVELDSFAPTRYIEAIRAAEQAGYKVLIIDSLSHAWVGREGLLEFVDKVAQQKAAKSHQQPNSFAAWREASPIHNKLVDAMLSSRLHLIVTMRAKTEYVLEEVITDNGRKRTVPRKIGLQPIQRDSLEYEFDLLCEMDMDNNMVVTKSRCRELSGQIINRPGKEVAEVLMAWLRNDTLIQAKTPVIMPATTMSTPSNGLMVQASISATLTEAEQPTHKVELNGAASTSTEDQAILEKLCSRIIKLRGYHAKQLRLPPESNEDLAGKGIDELNAICAQLETKIRNLLKSRIIDLYSQLPELNPKLRWKKIP
ncbi:MAG: ATP-binding protein, partial [Acidobacteriota bacterium]